MLLGLKSQPQNNTILDKSAVLKKIQVREQLLRILQRNNKLLYVAWEKERN